MNKILIFSIIFLSLVGLSSCSQEEIKTYKDTDNIYFSRAYFPLFSTDPVIDSTGFSFGLENPSVKEKVYKLVVRVQGTVSTVDRKIKVTVDPSSTAILGTHFTLPENIVFHAGKEVDTIPVTVKRTTDMKTNKFTLVLNLEENEFFSTKMQSKVINVITKKTISYIRFKLTVEDQLTQPKGWVAGFFGPFSAKKFYLMCDLMHLDPTIFNMSPGGPGLSVPDVQYYQNFMKRYLIDQKASGNTIYEENGTEMFFP